MSDGDELIDAMELAYEAAQVLLYLDPTRDLLRYYSQDIADNLELQTEFVERFWDQERGDWRVKPGTRVNTFCFAQYFLALRQEIGQIILRQIGPIGFLYQDRPLDSMTWIHYWQQGAEGLRDNEEYGQDYNRKLSLCFRLVLDPRMIAHSGSSDCAMSPVISGILDRMIKVWGAKWSHQAINYGDSVITISELLGSEIQPKQTGVYSFGIPSHDNVRGRWLVNGLVCGELVMEEHLRKEMLHHLLMPALWEQIQRAPVSNPQTCVICGSNLINLTCHNVSCQEKRGRTVAWE